MKKLRVLLIDNEFDYAVDTLELFDAAPLVDRFDFLSNPDGTVIHFPYRPENEPIDASEQKNRIKKYINSRINDFDVLIMDMVLTDSPDEKPPISLEIIDELKTLLTEKKIVFITGFGTKKSNLTENEKWDKSRYILTSRPTETNNKDYVECDEDMWPKCNAKGKQYNNCRRVECFQEFFVQLYDEMNKE